jgi:Arc/MetJ-type ribon-helix-helix transcriptional regulator
MLYNYCITTINISLPTQLKNKANQLVKDGFYVSFSDLVRSALRETIAQNKYEIILEETEKDLKKGKAQTLSNHKDIDNYFETL